jgi:hypothetical protein
MNDQIRPDGLEPTPSVDAPGDERPAAPTPVATFSGRTPRKTSAIRAGIIVGTGLVVVIGAAVAMGASPTPAPSSDGQTRTVPGFGGGAFPGGPSAGGFGRLGPNGFGPGNGRGNSQPGKNDGRGFGQITVTAVSGTSISLATADGWTRTIAVTSATKVTKGGAAATAADIAVGDMIRFGQTRNADGTYTITAIAIVLPQVAGTVTAVGADSITITLRDGTSQTIKTTGTTAYHLAKADGKRTDVTVGTSIVATGTKAADGTLTATSVAVRLPHVAGTVTATTADTLTLSRRDGTTVTIHVGSATTIRVAGVDTATLSDVKTGMVVAVEGVQRADGSIDAKAIGAGKLGKGRDHDKDPGAKPNASPAPAASGGTSG